ncbi:MAG: hypothetical protein GWN99_16105, partial [Gemmatimonadetes bacterium]|nr:hypothetical protein [Gemmatimonadota bacterium]NIR74308.1 hypothetical protein [Candidatus Kutchimonas denitrificans]NIS02563.1 hypothetical protein [Gemmatimonadota bacterium]NIT68439.1 hypothetical protein [Gemmatimonadota bacterium]NIU51891.1 hypothetical protein [Gemmatimonadota bacterium]
MLKRITTLALVAGGLAGCEPAEPTDIEVGAIELARPAESGEPNLFATADGRAILTWL